MSQYYYQQPGQPGQPNASTGATAKQSNSNFTHNPPQHGSSFVHPGPGQGRPRSGVSPQHNPIPQIERLARRLTQALTQQGLWAKVNVPRHVQVQVQVGQNQGQDQSQYYGPSSASPAMPPAGFMPAGAMGYYGYPPPSGMPPTPYPVAYGYGPNMTNAGATSPGYQVGRPASHATPATQVVKHEITFRTYAYDPRYEIVTYFINPIHLPHKVRLDQLLDPKLERHLQGAVGLPLRVVADLAGGVCIFVKLDIPLAQLHSAQAQAQAQNTGSDPNGTDGESVALTRNHITQTFLTERERTALASPTPAATLKSFGNPSTTSNQHSGYYGQTQPKQTGPDGTRVVVGSGNADDEEGTGLGLGQSSLAGTGNDTLLRVYTFTQMFEQLDKFIRAKRRQEQTSLKTYADYHQQRNSLRGDAAATPGADYDKIAGEVISTSPIFCIGRDEATDQPIYRSFSQLLHLLVSGGTGSGKSSFFNQALTSLLSFYTPQELRLVLMDMKGGTTFAPYTGIPHLVCEPIKDLTSVLKTLELVVKEAQRRIDYLRECGLSQNIEGHNWVIEQAQAAGQTVPSEYEVLPYILVVFDELNEGLDTERELEEEKAAAANRRYNPNQFQSKIKPKLERLLRLARSVGINVWVGMQNPDPDAVDQGMLRNFKGVLILNETNRKFLAEALGHKTTDLILAPGVGRGYFKNNSTLTLVQTPLLSDYDWRQYLLELGATRAKPSFTRLEEKGSSGISSSSNNGSDTELRPASTDDNRASRASSEGQPVQLQPATKLQPPASTGDKATTLSFNQRQTSDTQLQSASNQLQNRFEAGSTSSSSFKPASKSDNGLQPASTQHPSVFEAGASFNRRQPSDNEFHTGRQPSDNQRQPASSQRAISNNQLQNNFEAGDTLSSSFNGRQPGDNHLQNHSLTKPASKPATKLQPLASIASFNFTESDPYDDEGERFEAGDHLRNLASTSSVTTGQPPRQQQQPPPVSGSSNRDNNSKPSPGRPTPGNAGRGSGASGVSTNAPSSSSSNPFKGVRPPYRPAEPATSSRPLPLPLPLPQGSRADSVRNDGYERNLQQHTQHLDTNDDAVAVNDDDTAQIQGGGNPSFKTTGGSSEADASFNQLQTSDKPIAPSFNPNLKLTPASNERQTSFKRATDLQPSASTSDKPVAFSFKKFHTDDPQLQPASNKRQTSDNGLQSTVEAGDNLDASFNQRQTQLQTSDRVSNENQPQLQNEQAGFEQNSSDSQQSLAADVVAASQHTTLVQVEERQEGGMTWGTYIEQQLRISKEAVLWLLRWSLEKNNSKFGIRDVLAASRTFNNLDISSREMECRSLVLPGHEKLTKLAPILMQAGILAEPPLNSSTPRTLCMTNIEAIQRRLNNSTNIM